MPTDITVEVARTQTPLGETLNLRPGSIVPLNRLASEPVDVRAGGRLVAVGEVVVIDDEFGVRITDVVHEAVQSHEPAEAAYHAPAHDAGAAAALDELAAWQAAQQDVPVPVGGGSVAADGG